MKLFLRKLRDEMMVVRNWLVPRIQELLAVKRAVSQWLRRRPFLRRVLNLPSPTTPTIQEWMRQQPGGDEYQLLDPGLKVERKIPHTNDDAGNNWYYESKRVAEIDPAFLLKLQEGFVHGHAGGQLLTRDGNYVWDANIEDWLYFKYGFYMDSVLRLPAATRLNGTATVLAHRNANKNFSHWVFDVLPRIGLLERTVGLKNIDHFLVCHSDKRYEWETLGQLGIPREKVIQLLPHSYFQASTVIFPSISRYNNFSHQPSTLEFLKKSFLPPKASDKKRRLFISREDASFRRLIGEAELCRRLAPHGFEVITLAGVSLSDTAALFSSAEMIVGPFGSGLMNICFCPPGCLVIDIAPPEFYNAHHWYLAEESGLTYSCYFGNSGALSPNRPLVSLTKDINIDVDDCFRFIEVQMKQLG